MSCAPPVTTAAQSTARPGVTPITSARSKQGHRTPRTSPGHGRCHRGHRVTADVTGVTVCHRWLTRSTRHDATQPPPGRRRARLAGSSHNRGSPRGTTRSLGARPTCHLPSHGRTSDGLANGPALWTGPGPKYHGERFVRSPGGAARSQADHRGGGDHGATHKMM